MNEKKTAEEGVINAIENLAYKCIQWGDGELTGYDSQMLSSLLPIILKPLTEETAALREENERLKENCEMAAQMFNTIANELTRLENQNAGLKLGNRKRQKVNRTMKKITKFTVIIEYPLDELKKAYARYYGEKNWRKIKKSEVADWVGGLAHADIECDLDQALEDFYKPNDSGK